MANETTEASDLDGTPLLMVSVRDVKVTIEKADYGFLIKAGVSPNWSLSNGKYVTAIKDGRRDYVARMICMCAKGQFLSYADGNPLNLKRSNLTVMEKRAVPTTFAREAA